MIPFFPYCQQIPLWRPKTNLLVCLSVYFLIPPTPVCLIQTITTQFIIDYFCHNMLSLLTAYSQGRINWMHLHLYLAEDFFEKVYPS